jgi:hypothetical protein
MRPLFGVLLLTSLAFGANHAPLPKQLLEAKTAYIQNLSGSSATLDRCYSELSKWGRFQLVADPKEADIIFQLGSADESRYTDLAVVGRDGSILWTSSKESGAVIPGVRPIPGLRPAIKSEIKELRKRMEESSK